MICSHNLFVGSSREKERKIHNHFFLITQLDIQVGYLVGLDKKREEGLFVFGHS